MCLNDRRVRSDIIETYNIASDIVIIIIMEKTEALYLRNSCKSGSG